MSIPRIVLLLFRALFRDRSRLALENLALRQQLAILRHEAPRPRLRRADRAFWVSLARVWDRWRSALILVRPDTVLRWHRQGFLYFWRWKSRGRPYRRIDRGQVHDPAGQEATLTKLANIPPEPPPPRRRLRLLRGPYRRLPAPVLLRHPVA